MNLRYLAKMFDNCFRAVFMGWKVSNIEWQNKKIFFKS